MKTKVKNSTVHGHLEAADSSNKPVNATAEVAVQKQIKGYVLDEEYNQVERFNSVTELINVLEQWDLKLIITG